MPVASMECTRVQEEHLPRSRGGRGPSSQGMSPIADIVLKHALFQHADEQLEGGKGKKGALCHCSGNKGQFVRPRVILTQPASAAVVSSVTLTMHSCRVSFPEKRMGFSDTVS